MCNCCHDQDYAVGLYVKDLPKENQFQTFSVLGVVWFGLLKLIVQYHR